MGTKGRSDEQALVLAMNPLGWLAPAVLVALLILAVGLLVYPTRPLLPLGLAVLVLLGLGYVGFRRRTQARLTIDRFGIRLHWREQRMDLPWAKLSRIKGSTVWFDPSAVIKQPGGQLPASVRRAVIAGRVPKIKLLTFTRSLSQGQVGDAVRRHRPDLLP